ncbi:MAG: RcnB family protein [Pseudomonadales bacterium]|nr:RcnB family protein [Pseudomonadales bacterium]
MNRIILSSLLAIVIASPAAVADSHFRAARGSHQAGENSSPRDQRGRGNRDQARGGRGDADSARRRDSDRRSEQRNDRRSSDRVDDRWRHDYRSTDSYTGRLRYAGDPRPRVDRRIERRVPHVTRYGSNSYRSDWRDNNGWHGNSGWRDNRGRYWQYDRGWYDRYRVQYYRYDRGRYFARNRFAIGVYLWPSGYRSRVWLAGEWLPSVYWSSRYYIDDYDRYALYEPPYWGRWIRVGNDALLVDRETGEILDAVYDLYR